MLTQKHASASERGSILMEAVLVIPLYLIVFGGIMWVGDIVQTRQRLLVADRYAAWNFGNRHAPGGYDAGTIHQRFFRSDPDKQIVGIDFNSTDYVWSWFVTGLVKMKINMPPWTRGWINAGSGLYRTDAPQEEFDLTGRCFNGPHGVVMRTQYSADPGYIRNLYGIGESGYIALYWPEFYDEPFPFE